MQGLHYSDTVQGRVFSHVATPLGLAIPIYTATAIAGGMPVFNPPSSNREGELIQVDLNWASGTADFGSLVLMGLPLSDTVTGALCTAIADTTPMNGYLGGGNNSRFRSSRTGTCTVVAGVATPPSTTAPGTIRSLGTINLEANTGTAHGTGSAKYTFDGTLCIPPGWMVYLACTKASVALYCSAMVWKENVMNPYAG